MRQFEYDALSAAAEHNHKTLFEWARGVLFAAAGLSMEEPSHE